MTSPLPPDALRWRVDETALAFETTADVEPARGVVGQRQAVDSLRFGIQCDAPGQNVFVRGLHGTGRTTLIAHLLCELELPARERTDRCYVRNFQDPARPPLLTLPAGKGRTLRRRMQEFAQFVRERLPEALESDAVRARREELESRATAEMQEITRPFEEELKQAGLALIMMQAGPVTRPLIAPVIDGRPLPPDEFQTMREQGVISAEDGQRIVEVIATHEKRLPDVTRAVAAARRDLMRVLRTMLEDALRAATTDAVEPIRGEFPDDHVRQFLDRVIEDVVERASSGAPGDEAAQRYGVNVVQESDPDDACAVIVETTPTLVNLLGSVERKWSPEGPTAGDHMGIRAGALLRADGGYLILDARDVLVEPGAWKAVIRTLRSGTLEISPIEMLFPFAAPLVKPEAIPVRVRVILIGDAQTYALLDQLDPDFPNLFKVLADFDPEMPRAEAPAHYAAVLSRIAGLENLTPFGRGAIAALVEHGARVAARSGKVTTRFGRVADLAREAAFLARESGAKAVTRLDVEQAITRTKERGSLPSRRFQEYIDDGTIHVATQGSVVGQVNGLAVIQAGPLMYGFPARITASIGPGNAGVIDIEGRSALSGAIHTKGFQILGGLLRHLLRTDHPLTFSASLAFEQSYGGIDGDSASAAEACCLLSALADIPIRQELAITGAIDQHGAVQAIGGVNEKVEGFFETCCAAGLTGEQGVLVPASNAGDLMLREDVVAAAREGKFRVFAVARIEEAIEILMGRPAAEVVADAIERAEMYWRNTASAPAVPQEPLVAEESSTTTES